MFRRKKDRLEPVFGTGRGGFDLRLSEDDRPVARSSRSSRRDEDDGDYDDDPPPRRKGRSPDKPPKRKKGGSILGFIIRWTIILGLWGLIALGAIVAWYASRLPPTHSLEIPPRPPNIAIVFSDGTELASRGEMGGAAVKLKSLPKFVPQAFIAIEDRRFYSHFGLDFTGLARAAYTNITRRGVTQGGSTLTQQLAKNLFLSPERTMGRKVQEAMLALWLESNYSKDDILELYLNRVYFGAGAYGIEAAAKRFFGKPATALTLSEAATIAGLVKAPSKLNPTRNPDAAEARAQTVLFAMAEQGYIADKDAKAALAAPAEASRNLNSAATNYVADWVMDLLDDYIGKVEADIRVETTIDPRIQDSAELALVDVLGRNGARFDVKQGAVVVLDPDGAVKALVGGRNYAESQFNRAVAAKRQPGSSFKPFVYLTALEAGLKPSTLREDGPIQLKGWKPQNFTRDYKGMVPLSSALAMSLNTVAVRLGMEVGPKNVVRTAQRLGILSHLEANPSIALGTSEVSLLEMVNAYAPFANGGHSTMAHVITRVKAADGRVLYDRAPLGQNVVIDPERLAQMNAMLSETVAIGTARKAAVPGFPTAGKTGTSQDYRDAWFIGYTGRYVAGVWLGNDDGSPTKKSGGSVLPVEIWTHVMTQAHAGQPPVDLPGNNWRQIAAEARAARPASIEALLDEPTMRLNGPRTGGADANRVIPPQQGQRSLFERIFR